MVLKQVVADVVDTVEDFAALLLGIVLVIFVAGELYAKYVDPRYFWYPAMAFIVLLVLKLIKDLIVRSKPKAKS
jgi:hypothetical protein